MEEKLIEAVRCFLEFVYRVMVFTLTIDNRSGKVYLAPIHVFSGIKIA